MITIKYSPDGVSVPDIEIEQFVRDLIEEEKNAEEKAKFTFEPDVNLETSVSTANVITMARVLKKEEGIAVQFKFKGEILTPDDDGRLENWPDGFCNFFDKLLMRLL